MKKAVVSNQTSVAARGETRPSVAQYIRKVFERFWVDWVLMSALKRWPRLVHFARPICVHGAWLLSGRLRAMTIQNARVILGRDASRREIRRLARALITGAYDFLLDFASHRGLSAADLRRRIAGVEGIERYKRARAAQKGLIVVTAHFGAFEVGMAAMLEFESSVHVVFQRDRITAFERLRSARRAEIGVIEAPIDDGPLTWIRIRDALLADEVVLVQGDRVMPGQRSMLVRYFDEMLPMPTGPVRLAKLTGAPLLPIVSIYDEDRNVRVIVEEPIMLDSGSPSESETRDVLTGLARVFTRHMRQHPEQCHAVHDAWHEFIHPKVIDT